MNTKFTREARYVVFKGADIMQCLTVNEIIELRRIEAKVVEHRAEIGKPPRLDCVVVESDWPEYEPTWKAIEARVNGVQQVPDGSAVQTAARIMNIELIREREKRLRAELAQLHKEADQLGDDIDWIQRALQAEAQIAEMEKQEPIAYMPLVTVAQLESGGSGAVWCPHDRSVSDVPVYALPGAKGEEE